MFIDRRQPGSLTALPTDRTAEDRLLLPALADLHELFADVLALEQPEEGVGGALQPVDNALLVLEIAAFDEAPEPLQCVAPAVLTAGSPSKPLYSPALDTVAMASDPRCPECDSPVGMTSQYCMHCDAEFDSPVADDTDGNTPADGEPADDGDARSVSVDLTAWERRLAGWLGPDGWIDNSLTIVVAVAAGTVLGPLTAVVLGLLTGSLWSVAVGLGVWLGATASLANQRTVYGAVRGGCFGIAGLLLVLPVAFVLWVSERPLAQLDAFLAFELIVGLVVGPLLVVAILAGRLRRKIT